MEQNEKKLVKSEFFSFLTKSRSHDMVRPTGLEPAQPNDYKNLNLTRLPIPPWPQTITIKILPMIAHFNNNFKQN